jgi:hypothetical protein
MVHIKCANRVDISTNLSALTLQCLGTRVAWLLKGEDDEESKKDFEAHSFDF